MYKCTALVQVKTSCSKFLPVFSSLIISVGNKNFSSKLGQNKRKKSITSSSASLTCYCHIDELDKLAQDITYQKERTSRWEIKQ